MFALDNGLVCSRFGHDIDVIELAHLPDDGLCGRQGEGGQRGAGQVGGVAELSDARYGVRLRRQLRQDADALAHLEVVFLCGGGVHYDVIRSSRRISLCKPQLGYLAVRVEGDPDGAG